jgi:hypothetical protein
MTSPIPVISGVRQECVLSPIIFLVIMDEVRGKLQKEGEEVVTGISQNWKTWILQMISAFFPTPLLL